MTQDAAPAGKDSDRACIECLETVPPATRRCPRCGASQRRPGLKTRLLKIVSVALALLTFVLAVHELTGMAATRLARGATLGQRLRVAEELIRQREYPAAWERLEKAPSDERTSQMRLRLASHWLLDASGILSRMSLGELAGRLAPVLALGVVSGSRRQRADCRALVALAQVYRAREGSVAGDLVALFERAIAEDDTSALAHLLYGHFLLTYHGEPDRGLEHLERAARLEGGRSDLAPRVREWRLAALQNFVGRDKGPEPDAADPAWRTRLALVRLVNECRLAGWTPADAPGVDTRNAGRNLSRVYELSSQEALAELRRALPPHEHLALLSWLEAMGSECDSPRAYVKALLHEDLGEREAAVAALRSGPVGYELTAAFEELHQRLAGEPLRPLAERDLWADRARRIGRAEPGSAELGKVLRELGEYMEAHEKGSLWFAAEALQVVTAGRRAFAGRGDEASREVDRRLALYEGELLLADGRAEDAASILGELVRELPVRHALRGRALVELAAAHASVADGPALAAAVERIREAVDEEDWSDWAWIRWRPMLEPLHKRADYAALLERHGRKAGPPAGLELSDGR